MKENMKLETVSYEDKISRYQDAIHDCTALRGLLTNSNQDGDNDPDDRYWSSVFHKRQPDPSQNKETRLGFGFGERAYSVVFVYDHVLGKSLYIKADFDTEKEDSYLNSCYFAQCFESNNILVAQFNGAFMLYKLNPETMEIEKTIGCRSSVEPYQYYNGKALDRVVFEKTGLNYLAGICDGDPLLVKFDWESGLLVFNSLPGYMTNFGGIYCLFVKELEYHPIAVLGIMGKQKSDPDMGYSLFVQNGGAEKGMNLYNFKNEFFQQWTPNRFTFSEVSKKGYIQINVYSTGDHLITKTIVPVNMNLVRTKSSIVPVSDLHR